MLDLQRSGTRFFDGPAGPIEVLVDTADGPPAGVAIVAHPQPLLGGSARHKVPHLLARGLAQAGWTALRPNFRGVGGSAGTHDAGVGETDDLLTLVDLLRRAPEPPRIALIGFSFGAFVQACVAQRLAADGRPAWRTFLAGMPFGEVDSGRCYDTPDGLPDTRVVHGEFDERVALPAILDWARPTAHPVVVIPGADHFFTGKLPMLRRLCVEHVGAGGRGRDGAVVQASAGARRSA